jgi:hypothetical protein
VPIIINGASRCNGGWWAKHLSNTEANERVEVIGYSGLSATTMREAFREMEALAVGTQCDNYFYQANINPRADEVLTPQQWREAIDTLESNLGLAGQPRFVVQHEKEGRVHHHIVWSRSMSKMVSRFRIRSPPGSTNKHPGSSKSNSIFNAANRFLSPSANSIAPNVDLRNGRRSAAPKPALIPQR